MGFLYHGDLIASLSQKVKAMGSQRAVAKKLGISPAYLNDILSLRRGISDQVAKKLGVILYKVYVSKVPTKKKAREHA